MSLPTSRQTLDHIVPVTKGGTNDEKNLLPACHKCNSAKGNIFSVEEMEWFLTGDNKELYNYYKIQPWNKGRYWYIRLPELMTGEIIFDDKKGIFYHKSGVLAKDFVAQNLIKAREAKKKPSN